MRKFVFVTKVFGNITIHAHTRDEAQAEFEARGYAATDIEEVR